MRVLYVNHTAEVSGSERSLLSLLGGLPADRAAPRRARRPGRLTKAVEELGIPVTPITATAGSLRLHAAPHAARARRDGARCGAGPLARLAGIDAEVVHANSIRAGIELGLARLAPAATVVHVRDCLPPGA